MRDNLLSAVVQEESALVAPRFFDPVVLGLEVSLPGDGRVPGSEELPSLPSVENYNKSDPLTLLLFSGRPTARARLERCEELLRSGISQEKLLELARAEYQLFVSTAGVLRHLWRGSEKNYREKGEIIHISNFKPSKRLLKDCEEAGYSQAKVARCLLELTDKARTPSYSRLESGDAGFHSKNLLKWLQYIHPHHDSGWTVPWADMAANKTLALFAADDEADYKWYEIIDIFMRGYLNRYHRRQGGLSQRLAHLKDRYLKMLESAKEVWLEPKKADWFCYRFAPKSGMMVDVDKYRPSAQLFKRALEAGLSPRQIRITLEAMREKTFESERFADMTEHEWRMQRFLYYTALHDGMDVETMFPVADKNFVHTNAQSCTTGGYRGIWQDPMDDCWGTVTDKWSGLFEGIYPPDVTVLQESAGRAGNGGEMDNDTTEVVDLFAKWKIDVSKLSEREREYVLKQHELRRFDRDYMRWVVEMPSVERDCLLSDVLNLLREHKGRS